MAGRNSDSSSSSSSSSSDMRLACELSPKGTTAFKWQSSTNADGEYFSDWDKSAYAQLTKKGAAKYFTSGPIKATKVTVSVRWYLKPASSSDADSGMTGSASD